MDAKHNNEQGAIADKRDDLATDTTTCSRKEKKGAVDQRPGAFNAL